MRALHTAGRGWAPIVGEIPVEGALAVGLAVLEVPQVSAGHTVGEASSIQHCAARCAMGRSERGTAVSNGRPVAILPDEHAATVEFALGIEVSLI